MGGRAEYDESQRMELSPQVANKFNYLRVYGGRDGYAHRDAVAIVCGIDMKECIQDPKMGISQGKGGKVTDLCGSGNKKGCKDCGLATGTYTRPVFNSGFSSGF